MDFYRVIDADGGMTEVPGDIVVWNDNGGVSITALVGEGDNENEVDVAVFWRPVSIINVTQRAKLMKKLEEEEGTKA